MSILPEGMSELVWLVLGLLSGLALLQLGALFSTRRRNERLRSIWARVDDAARATSRALEQTVVVFYKSGTPNGKLSQQETIDLREMALRSVRRLLGRQGMKELFLALGKPPVSAIDQVLQAKLEAEVYELRRRTPRKKTGLGVPERRQAPDTLKIRVPHRSSSEP